MAAVRRIIQEKLASGGLVYVSYNCMPGWASELPVRRLLVELASSVRGDSAEKKRRAVELLTQMNARGVRYFEANPEAARAIESYARVPPNYLAHEFFNETWQPFYSTDVIDEIAQAGANYLGSATLADNHPMLLVEESATDALKNLASAAPAASRAGLRDEQTIPARCLHSRRYCALARPKRRERSTMS